MKKTSNLRKRKKIKKEVDWNPVIAKLFTLIKWIMIERATVEIVEIVCDVIIKLN
jgi:hypothetical protein